MSAKRRPHSVMLRLGLLFVAHVPCLLLAAFRSGFAGLTLLPLGGRLLSSGVWLWLLAAGGMAAGADPVLHGADQIWPWLTGAGVSAVRVALMALLVHDAVWPPLLAAFLGTRRANRRAARPHGRRFAPRQHFPQRLHRRRLDQMQVKAGLVRSLRSSPGRTR